MKRVVYDQTQNILKCFFFLPINIKVYKIQVLVDKKTPFDRCSFDKKFINFIFFFFFGGWLFDLLIFYLCAHKTKSEKIFRHKKSKLTFILFLFPLKYQNIKQQQEENKFVSC
jgi:hypothetical protein